MNKTVLYSVLTAKCVAVDSTRHRNTLLHHLFLRIAKFLLFIRIKEASTQAMTGMIFLKRERVKKNINPIRDEARFHLFNYIELLCNAKRRHGFNDGAPPVEYEAKYFNEAENCLVN